MIFDPNIIRSIQGATELPKPMELVEYNKAKNWLTLSEKALSLELIPMTGMW